jgi:hypothetical protein
VPYEFIDATSLLGPVERIAERLGVLAASGVTTCAVSPYADTLESKIDTLTAVARAYEHAGLG